MDPRVMANWTAEVDSYKSLLRKLKEEANDLKAVIERVNASNDSLTTEVVNLRAELNFRNNSSGFWGRMAAMQSNEASRQRVINEGLRAENEALRNQLRSCCSALRDAGEGHPAVEHLTTYICGEES